MAKIETVEAEFTEILSREVRVEFIATRFYCPGCSTQRVWRALKHEMAQSWTTTIGSESPRLYVCAACGWWFNFSMDETQGDGRNSPALAILRGIEEESGGS
jgi:predicted RNA-binding Zn-ribbon protein involved in translation (DUF1610 family)